MPTVPTVPFGLHGVFRDFPDASVAVNAASGQIIYWNAAAERLFEFDSSDVHCYASSVLTPLGSSIELSVALSRLFRTTTDSDSGVRLSLFANRKHHDPVLVDATLSKFAGDSAEGPIVVVVLRATSIEPATPAATLLLAETARVLLESTQEDVALEQVARLSVPSLADFCSVFVLEEDLTVRHVTVAHRDPSLEHNTRSLHSRFPQKLNGARGVIRTLLEGKSTIVSTMDQSFFSIIAADDRQLALLRRLKIKSFMAVPLLARGHVLGAITFSTEVADRYGPSDLALGEGIAAITSLAIDGYRQFRAAQVALHQFTRAQQELAQNHKLRALGQMASGVAHDVNNGLSMILGITDLLLNRNADLTDVEGPRGALQMIQSTADDAGQTVRGLREFYRPEEADATKRPVDMSEVVEQVARLTRPRWRDQALARGITIRVETYLADVPLLLGRDADLRQALTNLVFNSVDALPHGGIIVLRSRVDGDEIVVEVSDTGEGMSDEVQRRCVESYFTTKGREGSGLGLPMVQSIAERHGGSVSIESVLGHGTTVAMRLPFPRRVRLGGSGDRASSKIDYGLTLLLIGFPSTDEGDFAAALAGDGHSLVRAPTGDEGVQVFIDSKCDAVLLDADVESPEARSVALSLRQSNPLVPLILVDSASGATGSTVSVSPPIDALVARPTTLRALRRALGQVGLM